MKWLQERKDTKGYKFYCSECKQTVYYVFHGVRNTLESKTVCEYPYCPWCLAEREERCND